MNTINYRYNYKRSTPENLFFSLKKVIEKRGFADFFYEKDNWLGNVNVVVSDKKLPVDDNNDGTVDYYTADVLSATDYYAGGSPMPSRTFNPTEYRFGMNGQEKDDEVSGSGNHYTAEFWEYDPRTIRRWNTDPVVKPWRSPYDAYNNNPIVNIDPNGADDDWYQSENGNVTWQEGSAGTIEVNGETLNNIGSTYSQNIDENAAIFYNQDKGTLVDRPKTFEGFENSRYQKWDAHISYYSQQNGADKNLVKSFMIQESGFSDHWFTNDPMQMFNPGDYSKNKFGLKNKEDARTRYNETDSYKKNANGALSIESGVKWLYGEKKSLAGSKKSISDWLSGAFLSYPQSWRMAYRYNASSTLLNTNCDGNLLPRAYIYAERVHRRALVGENFYVPTGTANYNWNTEFLNTGSGSWGLRK